MFKKNIVLLILGVIATLFITACGTVSAGSEASENQVHMNNTNFLQQTITIEKGESITLIADTVAAHPIANGTWEKGTAKPYQEPQAPKIENVLVNAYGSATIGPFNNVGTFQLYCTTHSGMNLTVIVQ